MREKTNEKKNSTTTSAAVLMISISGRTQSLSSTTGVATPNPFDASHRSIVGVAAGLRYWLLRTADGDVIVFDSRQANGRAMLVRSLAIERLLCGGGGRGRRAIVSVACGADHSVVLAADGAVFTWGDGSFGCLGHGSGDARARSASSSSDGQDAAERWNTERVPRLVEALRSQRVLAVSASGRHSACIVAGPHHGSRGGGVWTWGRGNNGRLGHGASTSDCHVPTRIAEFAPRASDVSQTVARAIRSGGLISDVRFPKVIGRLHRDVFVGSDAVDLVLASALGESRAEAVELLSAMHEDGVFVSANSSGSSKHPLRFRDEYVFYRFATNDGSSSSSFDGTSTASTPHAWAGGVRVATSTLESGANAVVSVRCGWNFTLFLTLDGAVYACGRGVEGQCGIEPLHDYLEPTPLAAIRRREPLPLSALSTPPSKKEAVLQGGRGGGSDANMVRLTAAAAADGRRSSAAAPRSISPHEGRGRAGAVFVSPPADAAAKPAAQDECFVAIDAGYSYALGLTSEGIIYSWGSGDFGQLGTLTVFSPLPSRVPLSSVLDAGDAVVSISAGLYHAAAKTSRGRVLVWGLNKDGRLGLGDFRDRVVPTAVPRLSLGPCRVVTSVTCTANATVFIHENAADDGGSRAMAEDETMPTEEAHDEDDSEEEGGDDALLFRRSSGALPLYDDTASEAPAASAVARRRLARSTSATFDMFDDLVAKTSATRLHDARWRCWSAAVGNDLYMTPHLFQALRRQYPSTAECDVMGGHGGFDSSGSEWGEDVWLQVRTILVDLPRTIPQLPGAPFAEGGCLHAQLLNILLAFIALRPDIGYVQGMGHIAGMIAVHFIHVGSAEERGVSTAHTTGATAAANEKANTVISNSPQKPANTTSSTGSTAGFDAFVCFVNIITLRAVHFLPFLDLRAQRIVGGRSKGAAAIAISETTAVIDRLIAQVAPAAHHRLEFLGLQVRRERERERGRKRCAIAIEERK